MDFWTKLLAKPIVGLSPMDGVTDAPYRYIQKKYGNPDVIITEFVSVDGIVYGGERLLQDFIFSEIERPIAAQVFGKNPDLFFQAAHIICELGFDGMDINMGCPASSVARHGGGAALIQTPEIAKEIVRASKKGIESWVENGLDAIKLKPKVAALMKLMNENRIKSAGMKADKGENPERKPIPVSVKTRVGFDEKIAPEWMKHLTEVEPAVISLHGRTLKQMYTGLADWDEIGRAVNSTHIPILGNGDVKNSNDAVEKIKNYGVAGVLIGRASYGNPWIFKNKEKIKNLDSNIEDYEPTIEEIIEVVLEHANIHWKIKGPGGFIQMRKHLAWYFKSMPNISKLRAELVQVNDENEVKKILQEWKFQ